MRRLAGSLLFACIGCSSSASSVPGSDAATNDAASDDASSADAASLDTAMGPDTPAAADAPAPRACDGLAAKGTWEDVTPPGIDESTFGVGSIVLDPNDPATLYLGTSKSGLQKSVDCGAHWTHVDTGTLGADLDKGSVGVVVDPVASQVLFTGSLYGTNGLFKSTDGGVDWAQILNGDVLTAAPYGGFVGHIDMDPGDHLHLLVAWHAECAAPHTKSCYAETKDGGATWVMRDGLASWAGGEGAALQFLTSTTRLFSSASNGMWRSTDAGGTWAQIPGAEVSHGSGQLFRTKAGAYFLGSAEGVLYSPDSATWTLVPDSGKLIQGVVGNDTTVWASNAFPYNPPDRPAPFLPYFQASQGAPTTWTPFPSPPMTSGGAMLAYDPVRHVLYSANYWEGLKRAVVE